MTAESAAQNRRNAELTPQGSNPAWNDLDANGNWYDVPGQGYVWSPYDASNPGWDPYGNGNWVLIPATATCGFPATRGAICPTSAECGTSMTASAGAGRRAWAAAMPWWGGGFYGANIGSRLWRLPSAAASASNQTTIARLRIDCRKSPCAGSVGPVADARQDFRGADCGVHFAAHAAAQPASGLRSLRLELCERHRCDARGRRAADRAGKSGCAHLRSGAAGHFHGGWSQAGPGAEKRAERPPQCSGARSTLFGRRWRCCACTSRQRRRTPLSLALSDRPCRVPDPFAVSSRKGEKPLTLSRVDEPEVIPSSNSR